MLINIGYEIYTHIYKFYSLIIHACHGKFLQINPCTKPILHKTLQPKFQYIIEYFKMYGISITLLLTWLLYCKTLKYEKLKNAFTQASFAN